MDSLEALRFLSKDQLIQKILSEQAEFEEFKTSSSEIEKMLDADLEVAQKEAREKGRQLGMVERELERLQERSQTEKREGAKIEDSLRTEVKGLKEKNEAFKNRVRELEQKNDDLERSERNNQQEMEDLISKLNEAMERASLLENEIAERQTAAEEMYRLREELKERPRLVVGPLRVERNDETPDEPTPGKELAENQGDFVKEPSSPRNLEVVPEGKSFSSRVNRIMKDLIVKVDVLEGILTRLKQSPRA